MGNYDTNNLVNLLKDYIHNIFSTQFEFGNERIVEMQLYRKVILEKLITEDVLSNPADVQNFSCLGLCGKVICPSYGLGTLNPQLSVSI